MPVGMPRVPLCRKAADFARILSASVLLVRSNVRSVRDGDIRVIANTTLSFFQRDIEISHLSPCAFLVSITDFGFDCKS